MAAYITPGQNQDVTGRVLTYDYQDFNDGRATVALQTTAFHTVVKIDNIESATTVTCNTSSTFGIGSELVILITPALISPSSTFVVTFGTGFKSTGTRSMTAAKHGNFHFVFEGDYWVEAGLSAS